MKQLAMIVALVLMASACWAQEAKGPDLTKAKPVNFKKLMSYLPQKPLPGFTLGKPTGETQTIMNMTSSFAQVSMQTEVKAAPKAGETQPPAAPVQIVSVRVSDAAGGPLAGMIPMLLSERSMENESGYEKTVRYKDSPATEKVENTEDNKTSTLTVIVAKRFIVEISSQTSSDIKQLYTVADSMTLDGLAKES